jgi:hypothetical protein
MIEKQQDRTQREAIEVHRSTPLHGSPDAAYRGSLWKRFEKMLTDRTGATEVIDAERETKSRQRVVGQRDRSGRRTDGSASSQRSMRADRRQLWRLCQVQYSVRSGDSDEQKA